jgi:cytochrome P450
MEGSLPEPVHPIPAPLREALLFRIARGLRSWLSLFTAISYRVPIGVESIFGKKMLLLNDPDDIRKVLVEKAHLYPKHPWIQWLLEPLIGKGVFSANGEEWHRQRNLLDPALQAAQLQKVFPQMESACKAMIQRLAKVADGERIAIEGEMTLVAADIMVRTILSIPIGELEAEEIFKSFSAYQQRAGQALMLQLLHLPKGLFRSYLGKYSTPIRSWISDRINERLNETGNYDDLLQALIDGGGLSPKELVDQVCVLFLAGHETSASALGMAVYLMAQYPDVQQRCRDEVMKVTNLGERNVDYSDLRKLSYLQAVFQETLRLYPPLIFLSREAHAETKLSNQPCPMRAVLTISPWTLHRHRTHWPQPDCFDPERFLSGPAKPVKEAYLPFGLGPRKCPGAAFAQQEALLVMGELLRHFILIPAGSPEPDLVGHLTLRSRNGLHVSLQPIGSAS